MKKARTYFEIISLCRFLIYLSFRLKTNINRLFAWFDRFRIVHFVILMVFAQSDLWLPVMNVHSGETLGSSFSGINISSMNHTDYEQAYASK